MSDAMGMLRTDVEIESHTRPGERRVLRQVLVDTGSELSWAPAGVLESLGLTRVKQVRFHQADGSVLERWVGFAILHVADAITSDEIVFGEPNDLVLLGARTLEGMNLKVDLVGKRLVSAGPILAAVGAPAGGGGRRGAAMRVVPRRASASLPRPAVVPIAFGSRWAVGRWRRR